MSGVWEAQQEELPETVDIIEQGLIKLNEYKELIDEVPAYRLAMGMFSLAYVNHAGLILVH